MESPAGVALPQSPVTNQVASTPGHRPRAHPRLAAPVRVRAGAGQGDRDLKRHERHGRRHGREDGPDPLHGQPRRDPPGCARRDADDDHAVGPRGRGADRAQRRRQRGPEQPGRDPALRAGFGLQAGDVLGRAAGRPHQPELRVHRARPDQPGRVDLPRRRAPPDRAAHRHADPGPVLQHRDRTDRPGRRRAAPAQPGEGARLRPVDRPRLPGRVARAARHRRPVGADRLRVAAHRPGRRRQRAAGPRRLQRRGQRRHLRGTEAGPGHGQPVGRPDQRPRLRRPTRSSRPRSTPSSPPCSSRS